MVRLSLIPVLLLLLICLIPGKAGCEPETVTACGTSMVVPGNSAKTRALALEDAKRNAVETGLGTLIAADTIVNNAVLIKDRIYTQISGYVTDYHISSQGLTPDGQAWETCIEAAVAMADIESDLRAVGILKQRAGNPRFVVVYRPQSPRSAPLDSMVAKEAHNAITDVFLKKGFLVLNVSSGRRLAREMALTDSSDTDFKEISELAQSCQAEILLLFDIDIAEMTGFNNPYFKEVSLSLILKAVASGSVELVSANRQSTRVRLPKNKGELDRDDPFFAAPVNKLAHKTAQFTLEDTLAYFERRTNEGALYTCRFTGFSQDEMAAIVTVIENMDGTSDKYVRGQSRDLLQVDISFLGNRFDLQQALRSGLGHKGISIKTGSTQGTRLLFFRDE